MYSIGYKITVATVLAMFFQITDTFIPGNTGFCSNNNPISTYLVLSSLHISALRIYIYTQAKQILHTTAKNIILNIMTERIVSDTVLEISGDKGLFCLLIDFKCIVIVVESVFPFKNTTHYKRFNLRGNNIINSL